MLKISNLNRKHVQGKHWPKEKKLQAVTQWLALGNLKLVEATTGVSHGVLKQWRIQPWWKEFEAEIRNTENLELDSKLTKIVQKSLDAVADRLENGEPVLNQKTGEIIRKPVTMKDAAKVTNDFITKRELLRGNATSRSEASAIPVAEQMKLLAAEFAKMATRKPGDIIDVDAVEILQGDYDNNLDEDEDDAVYVGGQEGLQEGSGEVHFETGGSQEADGAECSPSRDDENRGSQEG